MYINKHSKNAFIISGILVVLFPLSVILHNFISLIIHNEEPFFFILALFSVFALPFTVLYALISLIIGSRKNIKKN